MPAASTVLTGLSFATNVAREATDAVPIVKQVLGVTTRIVALAEQIDKNREDLRALADRAKKMDTTIASITAARELDEDILRRLEGINGVLGDIEALFTKWIESGRFRRAVGYVFTIRKEVDRLKGDFDDRLRELQVAATLETNILARGNLQFIGEFRNIHHCDIDLIRRITPLQEDGDKYTINCHLANCDGTNAVVVVRDIVLSQSADADVSKQIEAHDRILEEMSLVRNRHPAIACLYGRNTGAKHNRFTVLKAGDIHPLRELLRRGMPKVSVVGRIVAKLADASHYLRTRGAEWAFGLCGVPIDGIYLDEKDEPKIGILADLSTMSEIPEYHVYSVAFLLSCILGLSKPSTYPRENQSEPRRLTVDTEYTRFFGGLMDAGYCTLYGETVVRRADIANVIPFTQQACSYVSQAHTRLKNPTWGDLLLLRASGSTQWEGSMLRATYIVGPAGEADRVKVLCLEDDGETMRHIQIHFEIPPDSSDNARKRAGGLLADHKKDEKWVRYGLEEIMYPGETPTVCAGWRRNAFFL